MAPHVVNVPLSLLRCPDGTEGQCFFQKHASAGLNDELLRSVIDSKRRQVIAVEDLDGLLSLVQAGVLEVHVRGSTIDRLDLCDRIVFDIDPGADIGWADIVQAARDVRERLAAIDLESFVKLSGGKGVHVVLPVAPVELGDGQDLRAGVRAGDGGRRSRPLRRQDDEVDAQGKNLRRLSPQLAGADLGRGLLDAGARRRAGLGAGDLGRARPRQIGEPVHGAQYRQAARLAQERDPWADIGRVKQKLPDLRSLRKRR